jgi:hypothetical protein
MDVSLDILDGGAVDDGSALLIIRVWTEGGELRARVTEVTALDRPEQHLAVETTVEATCARVLRWMTRFVAGTRTPRSVDGLSSLGSLGPLGPDGESRGDGQGDAAS